MRKQKNELNTTKLVCYTRADQHDKLAAFCEGRKKREGRDKDAGSMSAWLREKIDELPDE